VFDLKTKWMVREFQLHAKMDKVAKHDGRTDDRPYVSHLRSVQNNRPYDPPQAAHAVAHLLWRGPLQTIC
jgi:tRNA A37 threonylcarbamoyladenosine synthetase subunit TsaC/SUA5/YrdC